MSKQYNKAEKRKRRQAYLKRKRVQTKRSSKASAASAPVAPGVAEASA